MNEQVETCKPGDYTVTKIYSGYLVGRVTQAGEGPGPWWHYIATVPTFQHASDLAHTLADSAGVRAWLHQRSDIYDPLPRPGDPEPDWTKKALAGLALMLWLR